MGPSKFGPAEVGYPVACDSAVVRPGDIIVGDRDGVTVIPAERLEEVLDGLKDKEEAEKKLFDRIEHEWRPKSKQ